MLPNNLKSEGCLTMCYFLVFYEAEDYSFLNHWIFIFKNTEIVSKISVVENNFALGPTKDKFW